MERKTKKLRQPKKSFGFFCLVFLKKRARWQEKGWMMSVVLVWNVCSQVCKSAEVSVQSSVCVRACARRASFYFDISSSPSKLLLSPFPQLRHNNVSTTLPPVLPFDSQGLSTDHHQKARQGVKKKCATHTRTHTFIKEHGSVCAEQNRWRPCRGG